MTTAGVASPWLDRDRARRVAATGAALVGLLGLVTAVSGPARDRLEAVLAVAPAIAPETASVSLVFLSFALVLMGRGLRRGLRGAWLITIALMVSSTVVHLVHGSAPAASIPALLAAGWLVTQSHAFRVEQSRETTRRVLLAALAALAASVGIATALAAALDAGDLDTAAGAAAERLTGLSSLPLGYGGRFVTPALVAIGLCLMSVTLWQLLSPRRHPPVSSDQRADEFVRARDVLASWGGDTLAYFALRDDKTWFFDGSSVVAYAVRGGVCVVSPDPIGPPDERAAVWAGFRAFAEAQGWSVSVLGADASWLPIYEQTGLRPVYLGDEAIIDCDRFTLEGRAMRTVRQAHSRGRRAGCHVRVHRSADIGPDLMARLRDLACLSRQGAVERGFSMTLSRLLDDRDPDLVLSVAYDRDDVAQAFIQWVPCDGGWSLDIMRRNTDPGLTNGMCEFLIVESVLALAARGAERVGLNFAVFRTIVSGESDGWACRAARRVLRVTAASTQIESLWRFNAKFEPRWVPRYAVVGSLDARPAQSVVMAGAEGLSELPVVGRFMTGMSPR